MSLTYGDIGPAVVAYSTTKMLASAGESLDLSGFAADPARPKPRIRSIDAVCTYCRSQPGEPCTKYHPKRGRIVRHKPHRCRLVDARLMNKALDALKPREPDTITFRRPKPL